MTVGIRITRQFLGYGIWDGSLSLPLSLSPSLSLSLSVPLSSRLLTKTQSFNLQTKLPHQPGGRPGVDRGISFHSSHAQKKTLILVIISRAEVRRKSACNWSNMGTPVRPQAERWWPAASRPLWTLLGRFACLWSLHLHLHLGHLWCWPLSKISLPPYHWVSNKILNGHIAAVGALWRSKRISQFFPRQKVALLFVMAGHSLYPTSNKQIVVSTYWTTIWWRANLQCPKPRRYVDHYWSKSRKKVVKHLHVHWTPNLLLWALLFPSGYPVIFQYLLVIFPFGVLEQHLGCELVHHVCWRYTIFFAGWTPEHIDKPMLNIWEETSHQPTTWIYDDIWWYMMIYDDIWWYMMIYDDIWWYMMIYDDIWWCMMMYDDVWWCMMMYDDVWWCMMMYDDVWWCMMMYDDVWWCMMMYDDVWWCMMMYDDVWWCMMMYDDIWWYMMIYDDIWWYMMIYDDIWWYMMIYDDIWWYMMIYDDIWWYMMIYDDIWWYMMRYDEIWWDMMIYDIYDDIWWYMIKDYQTTKKTPTKIPALGG